MHAPSHPTLIRRMLDSRLKPACPDWPGPGRQPRTSEQTLWAALLLLPPWGPPLHQAHHLSFREAGKTRTVYVPQEPLDEVRSWVQEHQRLKAVLHEVSQLTPALIQGHVQDRRRRQGRRRTSARSRPRPYATSSPP